jgi:nitroreductase
MTSASERQPSPAGSIAGPVAEVISRQRAIRDYTAEPVTAADLAVLLDAACHTGTERNRQRWAVIVITDPGQRNRLAAHGDRTTPLQGAPLVLALVQEADGYEFDTGRIAQNIMLAATAIGLATCPVTLHRDHGARRLLGLRDGQRCRYALAIGHPHPAARPAQLGPRRPLQGLVHHDRYTRE